MMKYSLLPCLFSIIACIFPLQSFAEEPNSTLLKVKSVLTHLAAQSEIKAVVTETSMRQRDDEVPKTSAISVTLRDGKSGFEIFYDQDILSKVEHERIRSQNAGIDENIEKPTTLGMQNIYPIRLRTGLSKAKQLLGFLNKSTLIGQEAVNIDGQPLEKLSFNVDIHTIVKDKKFRQYVDDFNARYDLWVDSYGYPIKSQLDVSGEGSYFLILSGQMTQLVDEAYQIINDRLVVVEHKYYQASNTTFGGNKVELSRKIDVISNH